MHILGRLLETVSEREQLFQLQGLLIDSLPESFEIHICEHDPDDWDKRMYISVLGPGYLRYLRKPVEIRLSRPKHPTALGHYVERWEATAHVCRNGGQDQEVNYVDDYASLAKDLLRNILTGSV